MPVALLICPCCCCWLPCLRARLLPPPCRLERERWSCVRRCRRRSSCGLRYSSRRCSGFCAPLLRERFYRVVLSSLSGFSPVFSEARTFAAWITAAMPRHGWGGGGLAEEGRWDLEYLRVSSWISAPDISYPVYSPCPRWAQAVAVIIFGFVRPGNQSGRRWNTTDG